MANLTVYLIRGSTGNTSYILHLPSNYISGNSYPLVINIHGLNANAAQQQSYSQFDLVADTAEFIVVYPESYDGSWHYSPADFPNDLTYIEDLLDTLQANYSINNCLFSMGMSFGGFFSYKLACSLNLKAVAIVSGNFTNSLLNECSPLSATPIMHFHGTSDPLVNYNGTIGIPPVDTTIQWWVNFNNCTAPVVTTIIPDVSLADSSNVIKYYYGNGNNGSEVTFYKIFNGGHTWPGALPIPPFGFTNSDIEASVIIGDFFKGYCSSTTNVQENEIPQYRVRPNPFYNKIYVESTNENSHYILLSALGQIIWQGNNIEKEDFSYLKNGMYILNIDSCFQKIIKE
jgi:polyhydroxybutyrate depolymerase